MEAKCCNNLRAFFVSLNYCRLGVIISVVPFIRYMIQDPISIEIYMRQHCRSPIAEPSQDHLFVLKMNGIWPIIPHVIAIIRNQVRRTIMFHFITCHDKPLSDNCKENTQENK